MRNVWGRGLGSALALAVLFGSGSATADEAEARERYERALKLYEEADFDAALVELERAYELRPSYRLLYNIARVRVALNDHAAALKTYQQYLEEAGDKIPQSRKDEVQAEIRKLERRVAKLTIEIDVAGAEVLVDDVSVGTSPLPASVLVNSGTRKVTVRHPDHPAQTRRVSLAGGDQESLKLTLAREATKVPAPVATPAPVAPAPKPEPGPDEPVASSSTPWLGWVLTGVFAATAATTGVMALSADSSLADKRGQSGASRADLDSEASRVRTLAIVTDVMLVATVVAGSVSLWLTLDSPAEPGADQAKRRPAPGTTRLGLGPLGIALESTF